mgnify:CR=1 FL=1
MLEGFPELIPREDRDIAQAVREALEKRGITFRLNVRVDSFRDTAEGISIAVSQDGAASLIEADAVLVATGRKPATEGRNLEAAGVKTNDRGAIIVDEHLHTTAPNVYAIGDVTGGLKIT